jgi:hypothetical protein
MSDLFGFYSLAGSALAYGVRRGQAEAMAEVELRYPKGRARPTRVEGRRKTANADHAQ